MLKRFVKAASCAGVAFCMLGMAEGADAQTFTNEYAKVFWPMDDAATFDQVQEAIPEGAFSVTQFDLNGATFTGCGTVNVTPGYNFCKLQPANGNDDVVKWIIKPAMGVTFTPTRVKSYIGRFGTDGVEGGMVVTVKNDEGVSFQLGSFSPARNNKTQEEDKWGSSATYATEFDITLSEEQQAQLASSSGFTMEISLGIPNNKQSGFSQVLVEGIVDGTVIEVPKFTVTATASPEEAGSVTLKPQADFYYENSDVTLTATEKFGYDFVNWTDADGKVLAETPEFKLTVTRDEAIAANFKAVNTYALAVMADNGANDYMVQLSPAPNVIDGRNMYEEGSKVTLKASSNPILSFTNWSDGQTSSEIQIVMDEDKTYTASYSAEDYVLGWDFYRSGNSGRPADFAFEENDAATLNLINADGESTSWLDKSQQAAGGYEGRPGAVNWKTTGLGEYYWQTKFNASAFKNMKLITSMVFNYNAYTVYDVECSLDGDSWTKIGSVNLEGPKNWADAEFDFPADVNNKETVYLRWIADKSSEIKGTESSNDGICLGASYIIGEKELINDGTAPVLLSTVPAEGAAGASINGKIVLNFDEKVMLADGAKASLGGLQLVGKASGKTVVFTYKNLAYDTKYEFTLAGSSIADLTENYMTEPVKISFSTRSRPTVAKALYDFVVPDDGDFRAAITAANTRSDKEKRFRIFVKNGKYIIPMDEEHTVNVNGGTYPDVTLRLTASNTSIIGESMEGTVVINEVPDMDGVGSHPMEGIGNADLLQIQPGVQNTYFQNITLKHGITDNRGRNIVLQDKGDKTIMKDACLWGYQDTYTSNNDKARYYFEGGTLRGRTDFLCGKGDAYFTGVNLQMCSNGYLAVPSVPKQYGYIFRDCEINGENSTIDGNYTLGRPWGSGTPIALFINTRMNAKPSAIGWAEMGTDGYPARFAEYNSTTSSGTVIDLSDRKKTFGNGHPNNPVLTQEEADFYTYERVMGSDDDWDPAADCEQAPSPANLKYLEQNPGFNWDDSDYVLLWAVYCEDKIIGFTTEPRIEMPGMLEAEGVYGVRAANEMGGLGELILLGGNGVETLASNEIANVDYYTLQGLRTRPDATQRLLIEVKTFANGKTVSSKVLK